MPKQIITSATAPTTGFTNAATPSPLAQGIRFGNMLFVSGQGPLDLDLARKVQVGELSYYQACVQGMYTAVGSGDVDIRAIMTKTAETFGKIDFLLHSIAFASLDDLKRDIPLAEIPRPADLSDDWFMVELAEAMTAAGK